MPFVFLAAEYQDIWSFDPASNVQAWTDLSSSVQGGDTPEAAAGTLMANAGAYPGKAIFL